MPRFLSTLSLRRATCEEASGDTWTRDFYPRSPCGERRGFGAGSWPHGIFLSTLSLRRATASRTNMPRKISISIHALLAESDETQEPKPTRQNQFLSTLSLRRATQVAQTCREKLVFLSTLSLRRATAGPKP